MQASACYSLKTGKEAASCVPAFQVGLPESGQARLHVICARALQSGYIYVSRRVECGGLTAAMVVVQRVKGGRVSSGRGGPWAVVVAGFAVKPVQSQWYQKGWSGVGCSLDVGKQQRSEQADCRGLVVVVAVAVVLAGRRGVAGLVVGVGTAASLADAMMPASATSLARAQASRFSARCRLHARAGSRAVELLPVGAVSLKALVSCC